MSTKTLNYNDFCKSKRCEKYIEWECEDGIAHSCMLIGQSYDVIEYPDNCPYINEIKECHND